MITGRAGTCSGASIQGMLLYLTEAQGDMNRRNMMLKYLMTDKCLDSPKKQKQLQVFCLFHYLGFKRREDNTVSKLNYIKYSPNSFYSLFPR
jgi:hypothetical protein